MTGARALHAPCPRRGEAGATLAELLVVLAIISILAVTAVPFAETTVQRKKELQLQETLRTVRRAIDAFHQDWRADRFRPGETAASDNGYPKSLNALIDGVEVTLDSGVRQQRRYLRAAPVNPFARKAAVLGGGAAAQWRLIGYTQTEEGAWNGEDVYDLRAATRKEALNGQRLSDW